MKALSRNLPKLPREAYRGQVAVHWIFGIDRREAGWLDDVFHRHFREVLTHMSVRYDCVVPAYCLMPDHLHLVFWGVRNEADLYEAARFLRKHTASALPPCTYQKQPYDNVLTERDYERGAFEAICFYVWEKPVRTGLCAAARDYAFSGALVPGYPDLEVNREGYWDLFWRLCAQKAREGIR